MTRRSVLGVLVAVLAIAGPARAAKTEIRVVAHPGVGIREVSRADLSAIFLRKLESWRNGSPVAPVDQSLRSPAREAFSAAVLGMSIISVQAFWQKHLAAGGLEPPPVRGSDEEVLAFVASTPGAVGYISAATMVPASVREIAITR
jgi:ABC-type phosphate transport system substrate-binding protein